MMFLHRVVLGSALIAPLASGLELLLDDAGQYVQPSTTEVATVGGNTITPWTKIEGECGKAGFGGGFHVGFMLNGYQSLASYHFTVPKNGCYWVEEFHPDTSKCDFDLSSTVPVQIHSHKGIQTTGKIDQSQRGGQWNRLVKLPFYENHPASINISAGSFKLEAAGLWAADAFRLTWHAENCHDEEVELDETAKKMVKTKGQGKMKTKTKVKRKGEANMPLFQALVDDADSKVRGATVEPVWQCPATTSGTFHHDSLKKDRISEATFHFDPPQDGCYVIEERHPECHMVASANTKVHVNYGKAPLQAVGTVDQTANAGQWTFIASLQFYAGYPGKVTLSNEGTKPGTLAVFDQVRFTRTGESCIEVDAHPRRVEIRMTIDFKHVANRQSEFGIALKTKLAALASVPENSLRLTGLREGSIIAELLVLPSVVDEPLTAGLSPKQIIELLRGAVAKNQAELCTLTEDFGVLDLQGCNVEFKELDFAMPTIEALSGKTLMHGTPEQLAEPQETDTQAWQVSDIIIIFGSVAAAVGLFSAVLTLCARASATKSKSMVQTVEVSSTYERKVAAMEEGKSVVDEKSMQDDDNNSTLCPSDNRSEPSLCDDADSSKSSPSICSASARRQGRESESSPAAAWA